MKKQWKSRKEIEKQEDGSILLKMEVAGTHEIKFWVLTWGAQAKVIKPPSLRDEIKKEIDKMRDAYSKNPDWKATELC